MGRKITKEGLLKRYPEGCRQLSLKDLESFPNQGKDKNTGRVTVLIPTPLYSLEAIVGTCDIPSLYDVVYADILDKKAKTAMVGLGWFIQELLPARIVGDKIQILFSQGAVRLISAE